MRIAVIGAGAMGSIFGAALARSGAEVMFVDRRTELVEKVRRDGLALEGVLGSHLLKPRIETDASALGPVDWVLVLVDSNATPEAARQAAACLKPDGFALTLQNGIGNVEALSAVLGKGRVLAGSTYNSGAGLGLGRSSHTNLGETTIGELDGTATPRLADIKVRFENAGLPVVISSDVLAGVWGKFIHNCAINPVAALTGLRAGEIARNPAAAKLLSRMLDEILAVVARAGVKLDPEHERQHIYDHCWVRYNRPSMLQHIEQGRPTEIDALNGALVRKARELGMQAPVNEAVVLSVKALDTGRRRNIARRELDEKALELAAQSNPRNGRWGEG